MFKYILTFFLTVIVFYTGNSQCTDIFNIGADVEICQGDNVTLDAGISFDSYLWSNASSNQSINVGQSGTYFCTVSKVNTAINLITNGDFESGNTSFTSSYTYLPIDIVTGPNAVYGVINNPNTWFNPFSACTDHTSCSGNMMVIDGAISNGATTSFWCQNVTVNANTDYDVGYWITSVTGAPFANIRLEINGVVVGTDLAPNMICQWQNNHYVWNSGANTNIQICLYDLQMSGNGNDFAIDDVVIHPICTYTDTLEVTVAPIDTFFQTENLCVGDSLLVNGTYVKTSGVYYESSLVNNCLEYNEITVVFSANPVSNAGNDTTILVGSFVNLTAQSSVPGNTFIWYLNNQLISNNQMVEVQPIEIQIYTLVTFRNACSSSDFVKVNVIEGDSELLFPTAFSPNNDGINDFFRIITAESIEYIELSIYNRWGELVHEGYNENHMWNGIYKQKEQNSDLYIFIAKYKIENQEEKIEKGNLFLLR